MDGNSSKTTKLFEIVCCTDTLFLQNKELWIAMHKHKPSILISHHETRCGGDTGLSWIYFFMWVQIQNRHRLVECNMRTNPQGKNCRFSFEVIDQKTDETIAEITASATLPRIPAWSVPAVLSLAGLADGVTAGEEWRRLLVSWVPVGYWYWVRRRAQSWEHSLLEALAKRA